MIPSISAVSSVMREEGMKKRDDDANPSCSFCGKSQREVKKLIAGPTDSKLFREILPPGHPLR